jgi:hypothetical protein
MLGNTELPATAEANLASMTRAEYPRTLPGGKPNSKENEMVGELQQIIIEREGPSGQLCVMFNGGERCFTIKSSMLETAARVCLEEWMLSNPTRDPKLPF